MQLLIYAECYYLDLCSKRNFLKKSCVVNEH